ncbi:Zonular occludens toxin (Zot) [Paenibacillus algorifonticola]|uniref:Zonular occludens toxin (Zot) n=1 Tax=Paenibacillus algorifonticola TaxID=684063 RepID=A0A1I2J4D6_9BACL|nr:zonular occludens toxin domain-containing protein [Paenibacillus algorifonticola]SFF49384.1 Zonular occludens toxin (Zot) [Paenibacillus algorifonticola]
MIEVLTGLPGFGKTATAAKWSFNKMREGKVVYSNFPLKGAIPYHDPLQVLGRVKNALIVMDEAGILLDGLQMYNMPYEVFYELRQHRKDGVDLLLTAQSILDIAYPFRRLIQFENRITMKLANFVQVSVKDPQPAGQIFGKRLWYLNKWIFDVYRTDFKVKTPDYLGLNGLIDAEDMPEPDYEKWRREYEVLKQLMNEGLHLNGYDPARRLFVA